MQDFKHSKSGKDKKLHYELTKQYFREIAINKGGYYDAKDRGDLRHDVCQRKIWEICTSILGGILPNNPEITRVIDVGCGIGDFTVELAKRYPEFEEIVGIDFLKETIDIACENAKQFDNIVFLEEDLLNLPFRDRSFDLTICINTVHHIHVEDLGRAIDELMRITNKYLILEIRNKKNILNFWYDYIVIPIFYNDLPVYACSASEVNELAKKHNFQLQTEAGIYPLSTICRRLVLVYERKKSDKKQ